jgi:uncharacterized protein (DUF58 family)
MNRSLQQTQVSENSPGTSIESLLRRLRLTVLRPLAARLGGEERSLFLGPGMEVDELREYQPGDDVRLIDWNVTAREGAAYVRQSFVQRALTMWFVMDLSASIDWGTVNCLKRDQALNFLAVIGQILERGHNHLGAFFFADHPLGYLPPAAGHNHLQRLLDTLRQEPPQSRHGRTNLSAALKRLAPLLRVPSIIILLSDFIVKDGWQPVLAQMAQRHEIIAVRLADPRERELPNVGLLTLEDPETGSQLLINTADPELRQRFAHAAQEQAQQLDQFFQSQGIQVVEVNTGEELLPLMIRFLDDRRRQSQLIKRGDRAQRGGK